MMHRLTDQIMEALMVGVAGEMESSIDEYSEQFLAKI